MGDLQLAIGDQHQSQPGYFSPHRLEESDRELQVSKVDHDQLII